MESTVLFASSGDLESLCILAWLVERKYQVYALMADVGQQHDLDAAKEKALAIGAKKFFITDLKYEFITEWLYPTVQANCTYEDIDRLGNTLTYPVIARSMITIAEREGCRYLAHGFANDADNVPRLDLVLRALRPDGEFIVPREIPEFKDRFTNHQAFVAYAAEHHIPTLGDPASGESAATADVPSQCIAITFACGVPISLTVEDNQVITTCEDTISVFGALNTLARKHRIGRDGSPGTAILCVARAGLEGLSLNSDIRKHRDQFVPQELCRLLHAGQFCSSKASFFFNIAKSSQKSVSGTVKLILRGGQAIVDSLEGKESTDVRSVDILRRSQLVPSKLVTNGIGIVGGMGPQAGLDLFQKVIEQTIAGQDQEHPPVVLGSFPQLIVDRTAFMLGQTDVNPAYVLADVARTLEGAGASVCAMSCNSAHAPAIFGTVISELRRTGHQIRLLSILDETARFVRHELRDMHRVGVLSTLGTHRLGLYANALRTYGIEPILPDDALAARVHNEAIYGPGGIKAESRPVAAAARQIVLDAIVHLHSRGAQAVILGCTELPLAVPERESAGLFLVDPALIIARALIRATYPHKLKPLPDL